MYRKTLAVALAIIFVAPAIPSVAFAQYGGGGAPVGLITVPVGPPIPAQNTQTTQGQVLGASAYTFTQNLKRGSSGQAVVELQKILIAAGYLRIDTPTSYFGPATEAAVKQYQTAHGIEAIGVVGPLTRAELNKGTASIMSDEQKSFLISQLRSKVNELMNKIKAILALSAST